MNRLIKEQVEHFYNNKDTYIEGQNEKTFNKPGFSISLQKDPMKYFVLLESSLPEYNWIIHFENYSTSPFTEEEKIILLKATANIIKEGQIVTTNGGVTPGGIHMLHRMLAYGFDEIGSIHGRNIYWASDKLLDHKKFVKWLEHADKDDFIVTRQANSKHVTAPVVLVLKRNNKIIK